MFGKCVHREEGLALEFIWVSGVVARKRVRFRNGRGGRSLGCELRINKDWRNVID